MGDFIVGDSYVGHPGWQLFAVLCFGLQILGGISMNFVGGASLLFGVVLVNKNRRWNYVARTLQAFSPSPRFVWVGFWTESPSFFPWAQISSVGFPD